MYGIYENYRQLEILNGFNKAKERIEFIGLILGRNVQLVDMRTGEIYEMWQDGERTYVVNAYVA